MASWRHQLLALGILLALLFGISFIPRLWNKLGYSMLQEASPPPDAGRPLEHPPEHVVALYYTAVTAGSEKSIDHLIELARTSQVNAVVVDIKDYTGYIRYDANVPDGEKYHTKKVLINDVEGMLRKLHEAGIYVIARMAMFQDPALAKARPDLAVHNGQGIWYDNNGLAWVDPSSHEVWQYDIALAQDALSKGFDEINIDYVRFPSDGNLATMRFPKWDITVPRRVILKDFFAHWREAMPHARLSIDLFGFVTTRPDDFGVGQVIEDAFEYFDAISPMVYPSHYPAGFMGFVNPAAHPYDVVKYAIDGGMARLEVFRARDDVPRRNIKIRPWIQDFDLGADYGSAQVKAQIQATQDATGDDYAGVMIWNARNVYSEGALYPVLEGVR
jgi:hypothetical protein